MPCTLTMEPTFVRVVLHGTLTPQDLHQLADEAAEIEASSAVAPHRLTDLSALTAPQLTYPDVQAFAARRNAQPLGNAVKSAIVAPARSTLGLRGCIKP